MVKPPLFVKHHCLLHGGGGLSRVVNWTGPAGPDVPDWTGLDSDKNQGRLLKPQAARTRLEWWGGFGWLGLASLNWNQVACSG